MSTTNTLNPFMPAGTVIRASARGQRYTALVLHSKTVLALRVGDKTWPKASNDATRPAWPSVDSFLNSIYTTSPVCPDEGWWVADLKYPKDWFTSAAQAYSAGRQSSFNPDGTINMMFSSDLWKRTYGARRKEFTNQYIEPLVHMGFKKGRHDTEVGTMNAPAIMSTPVAQAPVAPQPHAGIQPVQTPPTAPQPQLAVARAPTPVVQALAGGQVGNYLQTANYFNPDNYFQNRAALGLPTASDIARVKQQAEEEAALDRRAVSIAPPPPPSLVRSPALQGAALQAACGVATQPQPQKITLTREEFSRLYLLIAGRPLHEELWNHLIAGDL